MCISCGCGQPETSAAHEHDQGRMVNIERDLLEANDRYAADNRRRLSENGVLALNLLSSPGAGKTTLLLKTIEETRGEWPLAVVEGDQQSSLDAERIQATGIPAHQINTGKGCHLDAHMVGHALEHLQPEMNSLLFIENVGNLVCPAAFDLGEASKVVILSTTEGEDKPLKYPDIFHAADILVITKTDLLPHLDFSVGHCIANARRINPELAVLPLSATTGEGMDAWYRWLRMARQAAVFGSQAMV